VYQGYQIPSELLFVNMDWFLGCFIAGVILAVGLQLEPDSS